MHRQNNFDALLTEPGGDFVPCSPEQDESTRSLDSDARNAGWTILQASARQNPPDERGNALAQLAEQSPDFNAIADPAGRVFYVNGAGRKLIGIEADQELQNWNAVDFFNRNEHSFVRDTIFCCALTEGCWSAEIQLRHVETDASIPVQFTAFALRNPAGEVTSFAMTARDLRGGCGGAKSLKQGEERLAFALEAAGGIGTWDWDLRSDLLFCNERLSKLFFVDPVRAATEGVPPGDFIESIHSEDRELVRSRIQQSISTGEPYTVEYRIPQPDGTDIWAYSLGRVYYEPDGTPSRLPGVVLDVTERKRTEKALERTRHKAQSILESITDGFFVLDQGWCFTYVNPAGEKLMSARAQELLGKNHWELFPGAKGTIGDREYHRAVREQIPVEFELFYEPWQRWFGVKASPTHEGGISVFFRDITETKQAAEGLKRQWRTLDAVLCHIPDHAYILDLNCRFLYANPAVLSLWERTLDELIGTRLGDLSLPSEILANIQSHVQQVVSTERPLQAETTFRDLRGEVRHYEYIFSPIFASDGTVEAIAGSSRDIGSRKQAAEQERERHEQLLESARLESLGVMAGGIAHDFNNLLVGILGNATLLAEQANQRDHPTINQILLASERAAELTNQMLAYSGKGGFAVDVIDVNTLVKENLTLLRSSLSKSVSVDWKFSDDALLIEADRSQIQQVIMNLLINASDAVGTGTGEVTIRTDIVERTREDYNDRLRAIVGPGRYVLVEVRDNGIGMTADTLKRIFDPFFTTKFTGRGLGLAAVLGIVKGHKGDIEVESELGVGTTFRVFLPASRNAVAAVPQRQPPAILQPQGLSVLIVDDEEIVRRMASAALVAGGFEVVEAANGQEAVDLLRSGMNISLVVLDLTMPVMNGERTLPAIKSLHPHLPVILSSGFSHAEISSSFDLSGFAGFLQKPYSARAIISSATKALLQQKA